MKKRVYRKRKLAIFFIIRGLLGRVVLKNIINLKEYMQPHYSTLITCQILHFCKSPKYHTFVIWSKYSNLGRLPFLKSPYKISSQYCLVFQCVHYYLNSSISQILPQCFLFSNSIKKSSFVILSNHLSSIFFCSTLFLS